MPIRLTLYAVVLCAMGLAGVRVGDGYRRREKLLSQLIRELDRLEEQMLLRQRALGEALRQKDMPLLCGLAEAAERDGAAAAWADFCLREAKPGGQLEAMEDAERGIMDAFWADLGLLIRRQQKNRFDETREALARLHGKAREETARRAKLYGSLGVLLGLAVVVMLW